MFCPNCGHKNEDFAKFCEECGELLEQYWEEPSVQAESAAEGSASGSIGAASANVNAAYSEAPADEPKAEPQRMQTAPIYAAAPGQPEPSAQAVQAQTAASVSTHEAEVPHNRPQSTPVQSADQIPQPQLAAQAPQSAPQPQSAAQAPQPQSAPQAQQQPKKKGMNVAAIIAAGVVAFIVIAALAALLVTKLLGHLNAKDETVSTEVAIEETLAGGAEESESAEVAETVAESESETETEAETAAAQSEAAYPYAGAWNDGNVNIATVDGVRYSVYINGWGIGGGSGVDGGEYALTAYVKPDTGELTCSGRRISYDAANNTVVSPVADGEISFYTADGRTYLKLGTDPNPIELSAGQSYTAPKDIYYLPQSIYGERGSGMIYAGSDAANALTGGALKFNKPLSVYESAYLVQQGGYNNTGLMAMDGDTVTSWQIEHDGNGAWVSWSYPNEISADVIRLNLGNWRNAELYQKNDRPSFIKLVLYNDKQLDANGYRAEYIIYAEIPDSMTQHSIILPEGFKATGADLYLLEAYKGSAYDDNCVSEIQVMSR